MILVTVIIVGLMILGVFGWIAIIGHSNVEDKRKRLYKNLDMELNKIFDGANMVTYKVNSIGPTLEFGDVVTGGANRGYELSSQHDEGPISTLVFKKNY